MARPKVSTLRDVRLKLSLTATEYECLVRRADAVAMRPSLYGRMLVVGDRDIPRPTQRTPDKTDRLTYHALSRVGNNLNQMMRYLHQTGGPVPADLDPLLVDIREIMHRVLRKWL